mmetsp:Transcript_14107/g.21107  ORF Transcript_14107/g.21107 Transcript_14107/m.21107 type:complete len:184 (+) Transcript_14107:76-627(+)
MAFFGLTALGYQNTFAAAAANASHLHVFSTNDFESAWKKIVGNNSSCNGDELNKIFRSLYHGPVPSFDAQRLSECFEGGTDTVTFEDYISTLNSLKALAEREEEETSGKRAANCDMSSSSEFLESIRRHRRLPRPLQQKQQVPLTASQEIGWEPQNLQPPIAGREGSHITKFAAELVKNGIYY